MGADITWIGAEQAGDDTYYFRDSYNGSNLAWVLGLSYWNNAGESLKSRKEFFVKLAGITDDQIDAHVERQAKKEEHQRLEKRSEKEIDDWKKMLREKRDELKEHIAFIRKAIDVEWSV